jgi:hypothetical protein
MSDNITSVVTGLGDPGGMQFVDTSIHPAVDRHERRDESCGRDPDGER